MWPATFLMSTQHADSVCVLLTPGMFAGNALHAVVEPQQQGSQGFTWMNDQPPDKREKWGYVATQPGAKISFRVNTTALATPNPKDAPPGQVGTDGSHESTAPHTLTHHVLLTKLAVGTPVSIPQASQ
jgi:hypothetical protein